MRKKDQQILPGPRHVGIILDGNRRWAKDRGRPGLLGHEAGLDQIEPVVKAAFARGVEFISLFVFRPKTGDEKRSRLTT